MPRSSRHKSHKQSKHSSRDYSDSDEDVTKMKEKSSKDDTSGRGHRDSASGEKRKISSQVREGKESKDLSSHGNGDVVEEYVSSKRRKEKTDVTVGGDRWSGGGDERGDNDRNVEKESQNGEGVKVDSKMKEYSSKGENLRTDSKNKSKRYESGVAGERKEDSLASVVVDREEIKSKGESKKKSERDSSSRKEGKESKDKDRRLDKEKNGGQESKSVDSEVKFVDIDVGKKQGPLVGDLTEERQGKRVRENAERVLLDDSRNSEFEKDTEKRTRRKQEVSSEKEKHYDDYKEGDERRLSSKADRAKDVKHRDDKHKDGGYADKYHEDGHKDDRRRDEKYREEADKDYKYQDDKYREDVEKDSRRKDDRHREDVDRDSRRKDEKYREGERDSRRKDEKNREGIERDGRQDDKYYEDADRDNRRRDDRYHDDGDKRYHDDGDRDDRRRDHSYRDDVDRDYRHKEDKYRDDTERDTRHKDSKQGDGLDRDKKPRDTKYRDERTSRDRSGDKSDLKRSRDDGYADHYARKSSAYDDSPTHDDRAARYRDDQGRRRTNEKEDYGDIKSRATKDQRIDADKKSASNARTDPATDRGRSTSRNADMELTSSHGRRRSSPTSNSHTPRDQHRSLKQDESKYRDRDYNYEDRVRSSTKDYTGAGGGSEKTSTSRSVEKLTQKDDGPLGELSADRRLKSDIRSSPLNLVDKSPSSSTDRRQYSRSDVRRSIDLEESTQRSGGSRDWKEYTGKDSRGNRDGMDVLPAEEFLPADADTLSVSSPFARNSHFSSSSKSLPPPPPFRTSIDSPLMSGPGDDDGRGKSNIRHRRIGDPNMGRIQGNPWRGVPNWHSPVANGFLPFPHAPPVGFPSVMQPFPAPPIFGVRPSMELNHPGAYHMPDADRFSGPGRPMAWRNQVEWDASNTVFGDGTHMFGRSDWDHSRNLPGSRGWETGGDFWNGPNRNESMEMPSSEKENSFVRSGDEALVSQSIQPAKNEQNQVDQPADIADIAQTMKSFEKNDVEASLPEDIGDVSTVSRKDDVHLYHIYLSKLDISADLTEPELFSKCTGLIDVDQIISSDVDDSKILYIEDIEANTVSHRLLNYSLFGSNDDSVFQKSMALYKRQKERFQSEGGEKFKVSSELIPKLDEENINIQDDTTEKLSPVDNMQGVGSAAEVQPKNGMQIDTPVCITTEKSEDPSSALEQVSGEVNPVLDPGPLENDVEKQMPLSTEGSLSPGLKDMPLEAASNNEEPKSVDTTKCDPLLNSDMFPEASEAMVPGSVNLSRIHHSPESTH